MPNFKKEAKEMLLLPFIVGIGIFTALLIPNLTRNRKQKDEVRLSIIGTYASVSESEWNIILDLKSDGIATITFESMLIVSFIHPILFIYIKPILSNTKELPEIERILYIFNFFTTGISGIILGVSQWYVIKYWLYKAKWWILLTILAEITGGYLYGFLIRINVGNSYLPTFITKYALLAIRDGFKSIITGLVFICLLQNPISKSLKT